MLGDAQDAVGRLRLIGDLVLGAFFSSTKDKERDAERVRRRDLVAAWLGSGRGVPGELFELVADFRRRIPAFHWMIEFPEVFWVERPDPLNAGKRGGQAWVDAFVGNPPFLGGLRISVSNGDEYKEWLGNVYPSSGHTDLSVYFIRRCIALVGDIGTVGLIVTNSVSQGANKIAGLTWAIEHGANIYSAERSMPWPGEAAVSVSVIHLGVGVSSENCVLDGVVVGQISSSLSRRAEAGPVMALRENQGLSAIGSYVLGIGFVFDDRNPGATPLEVARRLLRDSRNEERILSYISGEDLTTSPDQTSQRLVIDFGDLEEVHARAWPDLYAIVKEKVRPARASVQQRDRREEWWRHATRSPVLRSHFASKPRVLAISQVTSHLSFAFVPRGTVLSHTCVVFLFDQERHFALLQSRVHLAWAIVHASSLETRLRYTPTDCFETFPFPAATQVATLDPIGALVYTARAHYMAATWQGLTTTYNQIKDPDYAGDLSPASTDRPAVSGHTAPPQATPAGLVAAVPAVVADPELLQPETRVAYIHHIRHLHEELDRAVLAAYGWSDISVPPYCPPRADSAAQAALSLFEDTIIDRLFALNAERAAEEGAAAGLPAPGTKAAAVAAKHRGRRAKTAPNQPSLLDEDS